MQLPEWGNRQLHSMTGLKTVCSRCFAQHRQDCCGTGWLKSYGQSIHTPVAQQGIDEDSSQNGFAPDGVHHCCSKRKKQNQHQPCGCFLPKMGRASQVSGCKKIKAIDGKQKFQNNMLVSKQSVRHNFTPLPARRHTSLLIHLKRQPAWGG